MNDDTTTAVHWSFFVIGGVGLVWNLLGIANFVFQLNPDNVASMPESHRAIIASRPVWAHAAFAVAVFGGAIGCMLLLLRRRLAFAVLALSLAGIIVQMLPYVGMVGQQITDGGEIFMIFVLTPAIGVLLMWYARFAGAKNWLR